MNEKDNAASSACSQASRPYQQARAYVDNLRGLAASRDIDDFAELHIQDIERICSEFPKMTVSELNQVLEGVHDGFMTLLNGSAADTEDSCLSTISLEDQDRLASFGFGADEIVALEVLWKSPRFERTLADTPYQLKMAGFSIADCLDAVHHRLEEDEAEFYLGHGFTAHQADVIERDGRASRNLRQRPIHEMMDIMESDLPRSFVVNALVAAKTPAEADSYFLRLQDAHSAHEANVVAAEVAALAGFLAPQLDCCG